MTKGAEERGTGGGEKGWRGGRKREGWGVYHAGAVGGELHTERPGHLEATVCGSGNN